VSTDPQSDEEGNPRADTRSGPSEASERLRTCARPTCDTRFAPYRDHHVHCSDNCRKRAWEQRRRREMAEQVARELLDPERIEAAIVSFEDDVEDTD